MQKCDMGEIQHIFADQYPIGSDFIISLHGAPVWIDLIAYFGRIAINGILVAHPYPDIGPRFLHGV